MRVFEGIRGENLTAGVLESQLQSKGYALIRGLLPRDAVRSVLADITEVLFSSGWLERDANPLARIPRRGAACGDPDPVFKQVYRQVFNLESFHALPHDPALQRVMVALVGDQVLVHPKPIGRLIFPNCERLVVHAHQDYEFMGGDPQFFTAWIPLHDCPIEVGPLRILSGSHRFGIQKHERENLHVPEISVDAIRGDEWVGGSIEAGDVLIFHSLTVHAASPNVSRQMRISIDCRFQDAKREVHPSNFVFAGESGKSWDETYAGWHSEALKFYWRRLPVTLRPSAEELQDLAATAESISIRTRYSRMLSQLV